MPTTVQFTATLKQFQQQGDKTGWTYLTIPADIAQQLMPGNRKGFRVKGKFDQYAIKGVSAIPMGNGEFIIAFNAAMRKGTGKRKGAMVQVKIQVDKTPPTLDAELMECLADEPEAMEYFRSLTPSHQQYFSKWIGSAKTEPTKTKRIAQTLNALLRHMRFDEMLRSIKADRIDRE